MSSWLGYKDKISHFPLVKRQGCQISTKSNERLYILIDTVIHAYCEDTIEPCIKV